MSQEQLENIVELGSEKIPDSVSDIHCVTIIGQIEGHIILPQQNKTTKYEHIMPQLVAIEQNPSIKGFLLLMNTVGGDVEAGMALAELVAGMSKPSVSLVLGGGHSIGVPLAVSCDYSYISPTATMTVHPIRMSGMIVGIQQTFEYFDRMQKRVVRFICNHSAIGEEKLNELMLKTGDLSNDIGSVLVGAETVDCGLINSVGGLEDALRKLKELVEEKEK